MSSRYKYRQHNDIRHNIWRNNLVHGEPGQYSFHTYRSNWLFKPGTLFWNYDQSQHLSQNEKKNTTEFMYKFHSRRLTFVSDTFFTQVNKRHNYKYKKRQQ